jgi:dTDP-4-dehydrorhamnose 3,5-epimerase
MSIPLDAERGLRWNDSALGIDWPSETRDTSDKDRQWSNLNPEFHGLESMRGLT